MNKRFLPLSVGMGLLSGAALLLAAAGFFSGTCAADKKATPARRGVGEKVALEPRVRRHLGKQATVIVFLGVGCPVSNAYIPHLNALARKYGTRGVRFLGVNSNSQDSTADVAKHAREFAVGFAVLKDESQRIADALGAERVPEVVLLDGTATVRYRGRIDDRHGVTSRKERPTRSDLAVALDELLAGKSVSVARTTVSGCLIGRIQRRAAQPVTYANQVARILQKKCQACHRSEGVAPFALASYQQARAWAGTIKEVVVERRMPPWHADPRHGKFANDRSLTQGEIDTLVAWVDGGAARGADQDLPPPLKFPRGGWTIGTPDVVIALPKEFVVPAKGVLPYQDFIVETSFPEDRWIERAQIKPGCKAVHHAGVFVQGSGQADVLCVYVPGDSPLLLSPGTAKKIPAGTKLRFNIHYTPTGKVERDRTNLGLIFAKAPPRHEVKMWTLNKSDIRIPPGAADHREEKVFPIPQAMRLLSFFPHMHVRGKSWECRVLYPNGRSETILRVPRYDFNWQHTYRFAEPLQLPAGTRLHCIAHYDNSRNNPANPDPTRTITFGPQTWDEMMVGAVEYLVERGSGPSPRPAAAAPEPLPSELARRAAQVLAGHAARLSDLPIKTEGDQGKVRALKMGSRALLLLPDKRLTPEALLRVNQQVAPLAQCWLKDWSLLVDGKAIPKEKVRLVRIAAGNQNHELALWLLGVRRNAEGFLELVVYAKERAPLLFLPLRKIEAKQDLPIELKMTRGDKENRLTVTVLGTYQTVLTLAP